MSPSLLVVNYDYITNILAAESRYIYTPHEVHVVPHSY